MISLNDLELQAFLCAAETGSFRRAAQQMNLTAPAIGQRIHTLEEEVGCPLFFRHNGGVSLTPKGLQFSLYARQITNLWSECGSQLKAPIQEKDHITVASIHWLATHLLPATINLFATLHPDTSVAYHSDHKRGVLSRMEEDAVDIALLKTPLPPHNFATAGVLCVDYPTLVIGPSHPWAGRKGVRLAEVCAEKVLLWDNRYYTVLLNQLLQARGLTINLHFATNNLQTLIKIVEDTKAVTVVPQMSVVHEIAQGRLFSLPITDAVFPPQCCVALVNKRRVDSPIVWSFLEVLDQELGRLPDLACTQLQWVRWGATPWAIA